MSTAKILLYRHGRVDFDAGGWIKPNNIRNAVQEYDMAPLLAGLRPNTVLRPDIVVCSSLRRSIDSAEQLFGTPGIIDPVFDEAELPCLAELPFKLPTQIWFALARGSWILGAHKNCESSKNFIIRVRQAATKLNELSRQHDKVALIGHGILNRYLARELLRLGFEGPMRPVRTHGQASVFEREQK